MLDKPCVHLVGSVAMDSAEAVFSGLSSKLGPWLKRIPDGETGERHKWIYWQREMLLRHPDMEIDPEAKPLRLTQWDGSLVRNMDLLRFKPDVDPSTVVFETGYAKAALASYTVFKRLRDEGVIPGGVRFQVSLPTPMASGFMYIAPAALQDYLPAYEKSLITALNDILSGIDHADLSVQWDVCQEVLVFEDYFPHRPADYKQQIFAELARLGDAVPRDVELGYHLCYGTPNDEHLVMPTDMSILVEITRGLTRSINRAIDFIHMPVPKARVDDAYFAPLRNLELASSVTLNLGLIHYDDHLGDLARLTTAQKVWPAFGVSTECGWGRADPQKVPSLIDSHRKVMNELSKR